MAPQLAGKYFFFFFFGANWTWLWSDEPSGLSIKESPSLLCVSLGLKGGKVSQLVEGGEFLKSDFTFQHAGQ